MAGKDAGEKNTLGMEHSFDVVAYTPVGDNMEAGLSPNGTLPKGQHISSVDTIKRHHVFDNQGNSARFSEHVFISRNTDQIFTGEGIETLDCASPYGGNWFISSHALVNAQVLPSLKAALGKIEQEHPEFGQQYRETGKAEVALGDQESPLAKICRSPKLEAAVLEIEAIGNVSPGGPGAGKGTSPAREK